MYQFALFYSTEKIPHVKTFEQTISQQLVIQIDMSRFPLQY